MKTEEATPTQHTKACIFCFRTDLETDFSDEHIIPESIGGRLVLDQVCADCNSTLGHDVDPEILKIPDILKALEYLDIPHDREGIMRSYYNIEGETPNGIRKVRATKEGFEPLPQRMPDGSILTPDHRAIDDLRKRVERDERLVQAGLSKAEIEAEISALILAYEKCNPGDELDWPSLGLKLKRHQEKPIIRIQSKTYPQIRRFLAKLTYEFLFFISNGNLFSNPQVYEPLRAAIQGDAENQFPFTTKLDPPGEEYRPIHVVEVLTKRGLTDVYFVFFGRIAYLLTLPLLQANFLEAIGQHYQINQMIGIHFQQPLTGDLGFWGVSEEGEYVWLGGK